MKRSKLHACLILLLGTILSCKDNSVDDHLPPVAKMEVSITSGEAPLTITYTDRSTGEISSRLWEFQDGSSAIAALTTVTYTQVGQHWVRLTVQGPGGSSSTTETANVTAPQKNVSLSDMRVTINNPGQTVTLSVDVLFKNYANQPRVLGLYWLRSSGSGFAFQNSICSTNTPGKRLGWLRVVSPASNNQTFNDVSATWSYSCFPVRTSGTVYYGYAVIYDRVDINAVGSVTDPSLAQLGPPSTIIPITWN